MTTQELFDTVVKHLLTQNRRAWKKGHCLYFNTEENTKCAVGCLITEQSYSPDLEGKILEIVSPVTKAVEQSIGRALTRLEIGLLTDLQRIHDDKDVVTWKDRFESLATFHRLTMPSI